MKRTLDVFDGWVAVKGRIMGMGTPLAVLFEFSLSLYNGREPVWIPRSVFKIDKGRPWIKLWFHKQLVEKWQFGENAPKRTTKTELVAKFKRLNLINPF